MSDEQPLENRHAWVCGASAGIGRAIALALGGDGARITAIARREAELKSLIGELAELGAPDPGYAILDLDDRAALDQQLPGLIDDRGDVQILINNTGGPPHGPILEATAADFEKAIGRHLLASHLMLQTVLPGMQLAGYGRIINIVSTSVREPIPGLGVSNTTRAAIAGWAKSVSRELPPGITINNVLPGFTDTERLDALRDTIATDRGIEPGEVVAGWLATVPEARLGRPEEVAAAARFLASPEGSFIRGQSLAVDGGRMNSI